MAQDMPTILSVASRRIYEKALQKAQITLAKAPENVYKALNEAVVFNLSMETSSGYNLCRFTDKSNSDKTYDKMR